MDVSKIAFKRIVSDVSDIIKNPLDDNGIYYHHDEDNIINGYAMVIGPRDTPYFAGYYLFQFTFPYDYPHSPPKVVYYTNDGETRFNPNFYKSGKVCLSVLNTWKGEQWSACQTIRSILLILVTALNSNPLLNEPGIKEKNPDIEKYDEIILYKNIQIAIIRMIRDKSYEYLFPFFENKIVELFLKNKKMILDIILKEKKLYPKSRKLSTQLYNMEFKLSYKDLEKEFNDLLIELK